MAFDYFQQTQRDFWLQRVSVSFTGGLSRWFPHLTARIGHALLLNPKAPRTVTFGADLVSKPMVVASQAGDVRVHLFGDGERVAVLSHGWGDTSGSFQALVESLLEQGFSVAAIDHIGHGTSAGNRAHLPAFIETLELVITHLQTSGRQVHALIGHSMGGLAILNLPASLLRQSKVVLISVPVNMFNIMFAQVERFGISRHFLTRVLDSVTRRYGKTWTDLDAEQHLHKISDNVVFIHDAKDRYAPFADVEQYAQRGNVALIRTEGLGHRRILRDTGVIHHISEQLSAV